MKKLKYIVGNWKMNPSTRDEAKKIFDGISKKFTASKKVSSIICPSFLHYEVLASSKKKTAVKLGVQNFFHEEKGSYTGEVSIGMATAMGAKYAILGHSERRKLGETDEIINKKVHLALRYGITPILCIGESVRDDEGKYYSFIKEQLERSLAGVQKPDLSRVIIAYEPVWAVGALEAMNSHNVHEMTIFIKKVLVDIYKIKGDVNVPILYGGAVDPTNAQSILSDGQADGLLIGRQSLIPESFLEIIKLASNA